MFYIFNSVYYISYFPIMRILLPAAACNSKYDAAYCVLLRAVIVITKCT